ncbi:hypothetical protein [Lacrimispora indolis]|uniref:hypothetical protein n=1 Tax=Lacrimispora indolis TaxID=69825 RepID=UPI0004062454|nr:hypothetical protein [[Clostridium] methoxybenzovorans]
MKAKPSNDRERNLFTEIDLQIMLCSEKIKNHRRSIQKAKKMCGWYGPNEVGGLDYSRDSAPGVHISFLEGLEMIKLDEERIKTLTEERKELHRSKKRIEKIYSSLTGYENQVFYYRVISKLTQAKTADEMSLSVRQVQRIEGDMKEKGLM